MPQIRIQTQDAQISMKTNPAKQHIEQPQAEQSIQQPKADVTIERTPSKLSIDQSQAWYDMDLKNVFERTEEAAQNAKQAVAEGTARRAREGDELMKIENGGNPIAQQAKQNSEGQPKQFNIGWIPSHGAVKIDYQPSEVHTNVKRNEPIIDVQTNKPTHQYQQGNVELSANKPNVEVDFDNLKYKGVGGFEIMI
ncbi:DUF6470 family protein [Aquibacillus sediminis]|uniref:DUF6470 family protein n=1 Tax=Aquibacillus sediminis TaxID=2574734 RepID=UPI00319DE05D